MGHDISILAGRWEEIGHLAAPVRIAVFVDEQGIPREEEWDELDAVSRHFVAVPRDQCEGIGTARLTPDGHVGRMAVLPAWRRRGIGRLLVQAAMDAARDEAGLDRIELAAQLRALPFYESLGFEAFGHVFHEVGIPHRMMRRRLERE